MPSVFGSYNSAYYIVPKKKKGKKNMRREEKEKEKGKKGEGREGRTRGGKVTFYIALIRLPKQNKTKQIPTQTGWFKLKKFTSHSSQDWSPKSRLQQTWFLPVATS